MVMKNPFKLLYGSQKVNYESTLSVDEIKKRLSGTLKSPLYIPIVGKPIQGKVKGSKIIIYRPQASILGMLLFFPALMTANMNPPIFKGELFDSHGKTTLKGEFALSLRSKISYTFLYVFYFLAFIVLNITLFEIYNEGKTNLVSLLMTWGGTPLCQNSCHLKDES